MSDSTASNRLLIALWACGSVLGAATSIATWMLHMGGWVLSVSNFLYLFALPGWVPLYALGLIGVRSNPAAVVLVNMFAWGVWCWGIWIVLRVRDRLLHAGGGGVAATERTQAAEPVDRSRRSFLANGVLGAGAIGAVASPGYATLVEPWSIRVRQYSVPVRGLPAALEGLRVVQFSDPHLGPRIPASFYASAVDVAARLRPDLLLLTGDYVHFGTEKIDEAARLCRPMIEASRLGAVGVLGNHDWWGDGVRMAEALRAQGVAMIDNDRVWLDPAGGGLSGTPVAGGLALVGLGDLTEDGVEPGRAFRGVGGDDPVLVLAHQPDTAELPVFRGADRPRVDVMFSGHTHGGQVRIPFVGTPVVPSAYGSKYAGGVVEGPSFPVVVSRGIGMSLLPVRFGVPPEIVEVTLTRA